MFSKSFYSSRSETEIKKQIEKEDFNPLKISNGPRDIYSPHSHTEMKLLAILSGSMEVKVASSPKYH